jgi:LacI family transcriptional regulator
MSSIIDQIARDLNVSSASVSRALNDRPGVGTQLRERILQRARELNYAPGVTGRGLAKSRTFSIGFFVREKPGLSTHTDPFYGEILHGVEQACARTDYHVTIATLTEDILLRPDTFRFVRERRIDGMILAGPDIPSDFVMAMLQTEIPVVLVDNRLAYSAANCVNSDDENGASAAADYLLELGHRRIGVISGPGSWPSNERRVRGYARSLQRAGLPLEIVHVDRTTIESGQEAYHRIIADHPDLTALCAVNDSMAMGAIRAARTNGHSVPEILSVVGFDDIAWAQLSDPPLTTVNIPKHQMGREAAHRLVALLDDSGLLPTEITVSVQLVERESCRAIQA